MARTPKIVIQIGRLVAITPIIHTGLVADIGEGAIAAISEELVGLAALDDVEVEETAPPGVSGPIQGRKTPLLRPEGNYSK